MGYHQPVDIISIVFGHSGIVSCRQSTHLKKLSSYSNRLFNSCMTGLFWISTCQFALVLTLFNAPAGEDDGLPPPSRFMILTASKMKAPRFEDFDDIYCEWENKEQYYFFSFLSMWNILITSSSTSSESVVLSKQPGSKVTWEKWNLEDEGRAELPVHGTDDTFPCGMCLDLTSTVPIPYGENEIPPSPLFVLLSDHGMLAPYMVFNVKPPPGTSYNFVKPPQALKGDIPVLCTEKSDADDRVQAYTPESVNLVTGRKPAALVSGIGAFKSNPIEDTPSQSIDIHCSRETPAVFPHYNGSGNRDKLEERCILDKPPDGRGIVKDCVFAEIKSALCRFKRPDGDRGTAFIAQYTTKPDGTEQETTALLLCTNHHVMVKDSKNLEDFINNSEIMFKPSQREIKIKLADISKQGLLYDQKLDFSFKPLNEDKFTKFCEKEELTIYPINLNDYAIIKDGDLIYVCQYPGDEEALSWSSSECGVKGPYLIHKAGTVQGSSGSPILKPISKDKVGIVGIHQRREELGYKFGTYFKEIIKFIHNDNYNFEESIRIRHLDKHARDVLHI